MRSIAELWIIEVFHWDEQYKWAPKVEKPE